MPISIGWRDQARDDLASLIRYIASKNPLAAFVYLHDIERAVGRLADFPEHGRRYDDRYRVLVCRAHLIFYRFEPASSLVTIVAVLDGRRSLLPLLEDR